MQYLYSVFGIKIFLLIQFAPLATTTQDRGPLNKLLEMEKQSDQMTSSTRNMNKGSIWQRFMYGCGKCGYACNLPFKFRPLYSLKTMHE